ncbi:TMEM165/GDT1 family protein [Pandoraea bronchicola]|uniref:TMEM165/GDT1 family protein n=1 Tax=Pandoraea bronchicola TaxID=2508287 RepID=UPI001FEC867D|nr:TMEM165/GDT1 family protein [Pandoraea bronchicola]
MSPFLISTGVVGLAEIGDKTQLLALLLAARFKKPVPIVLGILVATLVNHGFAGALGEWLSTAISPAIMKWAIVASFIGMAIWILIPDKVDDEDTTTKRQLGVFATTVLAFFIAEMGDKTQIATVMLAARYQDFFGVVAGTTLGMMLANVPAVLVGHKFAGRLPTKAVHIVAAVIFAVLGIVTLMQ